MYSLPIRLGAPAVPGISATVTLVDSTVTFGKMGLRMNNIHRVIMAFPGLDQAGTLTGYKSPDGGANWYQDTFAPSGSTTLPATVAAQTATVTTEFDIDVSTADDVKFTFTAGGTAPTVWKPVITLEPKRVSGV